MASHDDSEEEKRTPGENMGKFNSRHFKRKKCDMNEASKKVRNRKE